MVFGEASNGADMGEDTTALALELDTEWGKGDCGPSYMPFPNAGLARVLCAWSWITRANIPRCWTEQRERSSFSYPLGSMLCMHLPVIDALEQAIYARRPAQSLIPSVGRVGDP